MALFIVATTSETIFLSRDVVYIYASAIFKNRNHFTCVAFSLNITNNK